MRWPRNKDQLFALLVILPSLVLVAIFLYGFIAQNLYTSLTDWGRDPAQALSAKPVIRFLGLDNVLDAIVEGEWARTAAGPVPVPPGTPPGPVRLLVRPSALRLDPHGEIEGVVRSRVFRGSDYSVQIEAGGTAIEAILPRAPQPGERVRLAVDRDGVSRLEAP